MIHDVWGGGRGERRMETMTRDVKERGMIDGGSWRWWWCGCGWGGR